MKKLLSFLLALTLLLSAAGCAPIAPTPTEPVTTEVLTPLTTAPETTEALTLPEASEALTQPETTEPPVTLPEQTDPPRTEPPATEAQPYLDPNGSYTYRDDVALYIHLYGRLPNNFITKNEADNRYGTTKVSKYGLCIGGDRFYNREGQLPGGYTYYECDIGTLYSSSRGQKRLVFTYSGLIYYTSDHYRSFTLLYGNP